MKRKSPKKVAWSSIYEYINGGASVKDTAEYLGITVTTVYRALRARKTTNRYGELKVVQATQPVSITVGIPNDGAPLEIKLLNGNGHGNGRLLIHHDGIEYKHANQKLSCKRRVKWEVLDKIMQLGIL